MEETASHIDYNRWGTFSRLFNIDQVAKELRRRRADQAEHRTTMAGENDRA